MKRIQLRGDSLLERDTATYKCESVSDVMVMKRSGRFIPSCVHSPGPCLLSVSHPPFPVVGTG